MNNISFVHFYQNGYIKLPGSKTQQLNTQNWKRKKSIFLILLLKLYVHCKMVQI